MRKLSSLILALRGEAAREMPYIAPDVALLSANVALAFSKIDDEVILA